MSDGILSAKDIAELTLIFKSKVKSIVVDSLDYAVDIMIGESEKLFKSFIRQFYLYETKKYIRNGQGAPGTGTGSNLLNGYRIEKISGASPKINIEYDASGMAFKPGTYGYGAEGVLTSTVAGWRAYGKRNWIPWKGSYSGKYFSFTGTLEQFEDSVLDENVIKLMEEKADELINKMEL